MTKPSARATRNDVVLDAQLTRACGNSEPVRVDNLSIGGCAVCGWFRPDDRVTLTLPRLGTFSAYVRWARGGRAGLSFERGGR